MGNSCCHETPANKRKKITLLLVGLDNAGKTVTAKSLAGEKSDHTTMPTVGFSVIPLKYSSCDVRLYDLGGGTNIRGIWHRYFADVHGVIFVIDSTDLDRFKEARDVLEDIVSSDKIVGKPLLILANKQDQEGALDEIDVIEYLEIETLANTYHCPTLVQSCAANDSFYDKIEPGIKSGYDWLMTYIIRNYNRLDVRVQIDIVEQGIKEREEMLEKIKRIKEEREKQLPNPDPEAIVPYAEYVNSLNGDTVQKFVVDGASTGSSGSFPTVCHARGSIENARPKSAVQMVRHQLQLNNGPAPRRTSPRRNRTAPVALYDSKQPVSARERRAVFSKTLRTLKSAGDGIFTISHNKVGPSGDVLPKVKNNGFSWKDVDSVTVVDVD